MQRFFFDFDDGPPDKVGVDLASVERAEADARATLLIVAADSHTDHGGVVIRDEAGLQLAEISLFVTRKRPEPRA